MHYLPFISLYLPSSLTRACIVLWQKLFIITEQLPSPPPHAMLPALECIIKFVETKCHIAHNGYRHQPYFILAAQTDEEEGTRE
jgi:hypothetical protein